MMLNEAYMSSQIGVCRGLLTLPFDGSDLSVIRSILPCSLAEDSLQIRKLNMERGARVRIKS